MDTEFLILQGLGLSIVLVLGNFLAHDLLDSEEDFSRVLRNAFNQVFGVSAFVLLLIFQQ